MIPPREGCGLSSLRLLEEATESLAAEVIKVAHHGSRYASTDALLSAVAPQFAVISCGADNDFGHPHAATLGALARHRLIVYRTDVQGDLVMHTDGERLVFETSRAATAEQLATPGSPPPHRGER